MKKVMAGPLRWLLGSAPGVALLVIAAGVGVGYADSNNDGNGSRDKLVRAPAAGFHMAVPAPPPRSANLSDEDRKALEAFGNCMRDNAPQPGDGGQPPNPEQGKAAFESAYDTCKAKLTDSLRQKFEAQEAQEQKFRTCMEQNGAPKPPVPGNAGERPQPPSKEDGQAIEKAARACHDEIPGGPGGLNGPGGPPPGPHPEFGPLPGPGVHPGMPPMPGSKG